MSEISTCCPSASDCADMPVPQPPQKRQRTQLMPWKTAQFDGTLKPGKSPTPLMQIEVFAEQFALNLTPASDEFLQAPFGLDIKPMGGIPEFMGGVVKNKNYLELKLLIDDEMVAKFIELEGQIAAKSALTGEWITLIKTLKDDKKFISVRVVLDGMGLTNMCVVVDEERKTGSGWAFLKPTLDAYAGLRGASCKLSISFNKVWAMGKQRGITMKVDWLYIHPQVNSDVSDPFAEQYEEP